MAQLSKAAFRLKWQQRFRDNDTFDIDEADLREFAGDCNDSFGLAATPLTTSQLAGYASNAQLVPGQFYALSDGATPGLLVVFTKPGSTAGTALALDGTVGTYQTLSGAYAPLAGGAAINVFPLDGSTVPVKTSELWIDGLKWYRPRSNFNATARPYAGPNWLLVFDATAPAGSVTAAQLEVALQQALLNPQQKQAVVQLTGDGLGAAATRDAQANVVAYMTPGQNVAAGCYPDWTIRVRALVGKNAAGNLQVVESEQGTTLYDGPLDGSVDFQLLAGSSYQVFFTKLVSGQEAAVTFVAGATPEAANQATSHPADALTQDQVAGLAGISAALPAVNQTQGFPLFSETYDLRASSSTIYLSDASAWYRLRDVTQLRLNNEPLEDKALGLLYEGTDPLPVYEQDAGGTYTLLVNLPPNQPVVCWRVGGAWRLFNYAAGGAAPGPETSHPADNLSFAQVAALAGLDPATPPSAENKFLTDKDARVVVGNYTNGSKAFATLDAAVANLASEAGTIQLNKAQTSYQDTGLTLPIGALINGRNNGLSFGYQPLVLKFATQLHNTRLSIYGVTRLYAQTNYATNNPEVDFPGNRLLRGGYFDGKIEIDRNAFVHLDSVEVGALKLDCKAGPAGYKATLVLRGTTTIRVLDNLNPADVVVVDQRSGAVALSADTTTCSVSYGSTTQAPFFKSIGGDPAGFRAVPFDRVSEDAGSNFNLSTGFYTVPITGKYYILTKFRLADRDQSGGPVAGQSYLQGPHTQNSDAPQMLWFQTQPSRNGSLNVWEPTLTAGQQVRLVTYTDGFDAAVIAEMSIRLIKAT